MKKKRILSGARPTGPLHVGSYVGALQNWVKLQDEYECFYMIADWHALTTDYADTHEIQSYIQQFLLDWLSCGLDPERSTLFVQSHVKQHAELSLLLGMFTPLSWLERCPTYKEQLSQITNRDLSTFGFLGYPVLQAADIIVYDAEFVPVGEDQLPHLELAREIARRVNNFHGPVLIEPQALLSPVPRLLGTDGRKMSKSYNNCIYLSDDAQTVANKVMQMVTDPARVRRTDKGHPEVCSVFGYQQVFSPDAVEEIDRQCRNALIGCTDCKKMLADHLNRLLDQFRPKRKELEAKPRYLQEVIAAGGERARTVAEETMRRVRSALNLA
jgi:tryptophanyl-tRNA synthetase